MIYTNNTLTTFTMISSQTGTCGYPEDTWDIENIITNKEELLESLKEGYLRDSRNRNNYPILSYPIQRIYKSNNNIDIKKYYSETFIIFEKWKNKISTLLPLLRANKKENDIIENELKKLTILADKYGYTLSKNNIEGQNNAN